MLFEGLGEGIDVRIAEGNGDLGEAIVVTSEHTLGLGNAKLLDVGDGGSSGHAEEELAKIHRGDAAECGKGIVIYM